MTDFTSTGPITKQWYCFILIVGINMFHLFFQWLQSHVGHWGHKICSMAYNRVFFVAFGVSRRLLIQCIVQTGMIILPLYYQKLS